MRRFLAFCALLAGIACAHADDMTLLGAGGGGLPPAINMVFDGDSITAGLFCNPPNDYPTNLVLDVALRNYTKENIGTSGISLLTLNTNYASRAGANFNAAKAINMLLFMGGTNTSGGADTTALQKYILYRSYLRQAQATGYNRIAVGTLLARNDDGGTFWTSTIVPLNAWIRTYYNSDLRADALMDWGNDPRFSPNTIVNTETATPGAIYNTDLLHPLGPPPTGIGCVAMASIAQPVVQPVLYTPGANVVIPTWSIFDLGNITLSNTNRTATVTSGAGAYTINGFPAVKSGKYYWEVVATSLSSQLDVGIQNEVVTNFSAASLGFNANSIGYKNDGNIYYNSVSQVVAATYTTGDLLEQAWDVGAKLFWVRRCRSGVCQSWNGNGSANPATGVGGISSSGLGSGYIHPAGETVSGTDALTSNFAQSQFSDTAVFATLQAAGFSAFAP